MSWMQRMLLGGLILRAPEGDGGGGGGGSGGGDKGGDKGGGNAGGGDKGNADLSAVLARIEKLEKENAELKKSAKPNPDDDPALIDKVRKEQEAKDKQKGDAVALEAALKFNLGARDWYKSNATLLPKEIEQAIDRADKEKYDGAVEKARDIQAAVIESFFKIQANLDLLTQSQKTALEDYLKLTKTGKQEKAPEMFDRIFEPTFESFKRIKRAEQLREGGGTPIADVDKAYAKRLEQGSKQKYLGEKANA